MAKIIIIFFIYLPLFLYGLYLKKEQKTATLLEIGINHKLIFTPHCKPEIHTINIIPDKFILGLSNLSGANYNAPNINYCHWINKTGEKVGTTFLIKEDDAYQYEMYYDDFLTTINEIVKISGDQDFESALTKYFNKASKNLGSVSMQFEDLLLKLNVQYEKIKGI